MDRIGTGNILFMRYFYSNKWMEVDHYEGTYARYKYPIPSESQLNIQGSFRFVEAFHGVFRFLSFELMTNFATTDLAGNQQMGFTDHVVDDWRVFFNFHVPLFPTQFTPEAVVKLHYLEIKSGLKFTSFFKCKMGVVKRMEITDSTQKECMFDIINPHSHTYHSSEQFALPNEGAYHVMPETNRIKATDVDQAVTKESEESNDLICPSCGSDNLPDSNFCQKCGYNFKTGTPRKVPLAQNLGQTVRSKTLPAVQRPQSAQPGYSSPQYRYNAAANAPSKGKSCFRVGLGISTLIGAALLLFLGVGYSIGAELGFAALLFFVDTILGIFAGITAIRGRKKSGVGLCISFWVVLVFIVLIAIGTA